MPSERKRIGWRRKLVWAAAGAAILTGLFFFLKPHYEIMTMGPDNFPGRIATIGFPAEVPGGTVSALTNRGEGRWRLVVVPGTPSANRFWVNVLAAAPDDLETIVIERPGYGGNGKEAPVLGFDRQIAAFAPLLDVGPERRVVLLGQSYSGPIVLKAAAEHPDEVAAAMVLSGFFLQPSPAAEKGLALVRSGLVGWALPDWSRNAEAEVLSRPGEMPAALAAIKTLKLPVTVMHSDPDGLVPFENAQYVMSLLPPETEPELVVVPDGGHFLNLGYADKILAAVSRLIARAEAREGR